MLSQEHFVVGDLVLARCRQINRYQKRHTNRRLKDKDKEIRKGMRMKRMGRQGKACAKLAEMGTEESLNKQERKSRRLSRSRRSSFSATRAAALPRGALMIGTAPTPERTCDSYQLEDRGIDQLVKMEVGDESISVLPGSVMDKGSRRMGPIGNGEGRSQTIRRMGGPGLAAGRSVREKC